MQSTQMINARAETVHEKPAYRRAFKSQRALIPVDAFYEWLETDQVGKSGKKQIVVMYMLLAAAALAALTAAHLAESSLFDDVHRLRTQTT